MVDGSFVARFLPTVAKKALMELDFSSSSVIIFEGSEIPDNGPMMEDFEELLNFFTAFQNDLLSLASTNIKLWSDIHVSKLPLFVTLAGFEVMAWSIRVLDLLVILVGSLITFVKFWVY